ncbi:toxin glutamine deamidase domain-containing protein [Nocardia sp. CA-290969]|uniref:toxin glutamine deamidase domain-containing protein n=1 Tax=Nocardia sp. CA-290969 TaxID=3239986 RepID=UPI003D8AA461
MGIEIPEALQWVCKYVVGAGDWPEGDETAMRRVEAAWTQLATDLSEIGPDANHAIDQVLAAIEGDTAQAISDRWTELGHGQGAFDGLIKHIETLADEIGDGAADIEHTKLVILASLAIFAVEMAILLAAASTGIGAPAAGAKAAVAQTVTRVAVRTAIKQLLQRLISKAALKAAARAAVRGAWAAALEETALDLGIKAVQVAAGRRDEVTMDDLKEAGKTALTAAATGAVTGAMGPDGLTSRNVPGGPEGGNPLANAAKDAAKETVAGVAGEVAGEATNAALNDREFSLEQALSPENLSSSAAAGVQRGTETLGENNSGNSGEDPDSGGDESSNESPNGNPPGNDSGDESGDPGTQSQGQNQSQGQPQTQPLGQQSPSTQPSSTDTQTQSSSAGQQPPGQASDTGDQPTGQQPPGHDAPSQETPAATPEQDSPTGDTAAAPQAPPPSETADSPPAQPTESDTSQPQQPQPTDQGDQGDQGNQGAPQQSPETGTPQSPDSGATQSPDSGTQQSPDSSTPQPPDSGTPEPSPSHTPDTETPGSPQSPPPSTETPSDTGTPVAETPPAQDTPAAPGTQQPASSLNLPPDSPPQQPTSSLNLGPETTPPPTSPSPQNTPETSTTPGTTTPPASAPTTPGTPTTTGLPTTPNQPGTTTPTTSGDTTPASAPVATAPTTGTPQSPATAPAPATAPETTPTTTSAAATATPTPSGPVLSPTTPAETPRTTPADSATGAPTTTPTGVPRNQPRTTPHRPGDTSPATDPARPHNTDQTPTTPETGPNTPGYDYNIYDPANHARFLADFSRPPVPTRPTDTGPTPNRDSTAPQPPHKPADPATTPNRTDPTTPDPARTETPAARTDQPAYTAAARNPDRSAQDLGQPGPAHPNAPRPGDPIWNSPDQNNAQPSPAARPAQPTSPQPVAPTRPSAQPFNNTAPTHPGNPQPPTAAPPGNHGNVPGSMPAQPNPHATDRARAAREYYRNRTPSNGRSLDVSTSRNNRSATPNYRVRRFETSPGRFISVLTVPVRPVLPINATPQAINQFMETAQRVVDQTFNREQQLPGGDVLLVELVHTADPTSTGVQIHTDPTGTPTHSPDQFVNQLRHELGLPAETSSPDRGLDPDDLLRISNDIATANTPTRFDNPSDLRTIGANELQHVERPEYQTAVENALRDGDRFIIGADPRTNRYGELINDGGTERMGRRNNCLDCSLSALSSFYGNPQVSAPRWPDRLADGSIDNRSGEVSGLNRAQQWLGAGLSSYDDGQRSVAQQFQAMHDWISHLGPGSSALIVNDWHAHDPQTGQPLYHPDGSPVVDGGHATVVVYPHGAQGPVWWDPQSGTMSDQPPPDMVSLSAYVDFTPIPANPGAPNAASVPNQGTSSPVSGTDIPHPPGIRDTSDRQRLGVPAGADRPAHQQPADRNDQPGGQRRDGDSPGVPELVPADDRRGLHDSNENRPTPESRPDLPTDHPDHPPTHQRDRGPDPVPDQRNLRHEPGELPPTHRQNDPELPTARDDVRGSSVVDRLEPHPDRDMAPDRDNRLLTSETQLDRQDDETGRVGTDDSSDVDTDGAEPWQITENDDEAHAYPDNVSIAQIDVNDPAIRDVSEPDRAFASSVEQGGLDRDEYLHHADADPLRRHGPASDTHPAELQRFIAEAEELGVEIQYRAGAMAYGPAPSSGRPGTLVIDPEASYGAWLHEMRHMRDDATAGWIGMQALIDQATREVMERRAYMEEIRYARSIRDRTSEALLYQNLRREIKAIWRRQR